jgi:glycosyltransferase involved in cell wall biosynthesis
MLVTNTGGLAEIVINNKTGFVCEKDPVEIAEKISGFFNEGLSSEMINNIKLEKDKFSWESFVNQLVKMSGSI